MLIAMRMPMHMPLVTYNMCLKKHRTVVYSIIDVATKDFWIGMYLVLYGIYIYLYYRYTI